MQQTGLYFSSYRVQTEQQTLMCSLQLNIRDTLLLVGQFCNEEFALDTNTALKFILYYSLQLAEVF